MSAFYFICDLKYIALIIHDLIRSIPFVSEIERSLIYYEYINDIKHSKLRPCKE